MNTPKYILDEKRAAIKGIEESIKRLQDAKEALEREIMRETPLHEFIVSLPKRGYMTWVIRNNTYYQFVGFNGRGVIISRYGNATELPIQRFNSEYRLAEPAEVKQHEEYLASKSSGKTLIAAIKGEDIKHVIDPMKCDFYMVTCTGQHGSKVRHADYASAEKEAMRISKLMNHEAWIVGVVASVKPITQTQTTFKVTKR